MGLETYRDLELGRHAAGLGTWRSGGALQAYTCGGICLKSPGALEARCRRRDVEVFASRAREVRCRRVDVEIVEVSRCGALEACRRCRDVEEAQRYGALAYLLLLLEFLAFVPQGSLGKIAFGSRHQCTSGMKSWSPRKIVGYSPEIADISLIIVHPPLIRASILLGWPWHCCLVSSKTKLPLAP